VAIGYLVITLTISGAFNSDRAAGGHPPVTSILFDAPGPRARRRSLIGSIIGGILLLAVAVMVAIRLEDSGQFRSDFWEPFTDAGIQRGFAAGPGGHAQGGRHLDRLRAPARLGPGRGAAVHASPLRWLATLVVEFFRAMPLVLLIFFARFGLRSSASTSTCCGTSYRSLAVQRRRLAEILRAGILAVPRGSRKRLMPSASARRR
jgi:glutamate transport system permease protein